MEFGISHKGFFCIISEFWISEQGDLAIPSFTGYFWKKLILISLVEHQLLCCWHFTKIIKSKLAFIQEQRYLAIISYHMLLMGWLSASQPFSRKHRKRCLTKNDRSTLKFTKIERTPLRQKDLISTLNQRLFVS